MKIEKIIEKISPLAEEDSDQNIHAFVCEMCGKNVAYLLLAMCEGIRATDGRYYRVNGYGDIPLKAGEALAILNFFVDFGVSATLTECPDTKRANYPFSRSRHLQSLSK